MLKNTPTFEVGQKGMFLGPELRCRVEVIKVLEDGNPRFETIGYPEEGSSIMIVPDTEFVPDNNVRWAFEVDPNPSN